MIKLKLIAKFIFFFFGTFLHESAHYIAALLLGKPSGFSLLPRIEGDRFIFGSVRYRVRFNILSSLIALAPLLWWLAVVLLMYHFKLVSSTKWIPDINYSLLWGRLKTFSLLDAFFIWLLLQVLWAGRPSIQDIRVFFVGLFSVSGLVFVSAIALAFYLVRYFL